MSCYGLIGYPLTHTFSPAFFGEKFAALGLKDYQYQAYPIGDISQIHALLKSEKLHGFNVTIPYKKSILPLLDQCSNVVKEIQSCNCVKIEKELLTGYNTDVIGFEKSLLTLISSHHRKAIILGTGGSSAAVAYVLKKLGIDFYFVSRNPKNERTIGYPDLSREIIAAHTLIVNTTPLGMHPNVTGYPDIPYQYLTQKHYLFDLIYNPSKTLFIEKGTDQGATVKNGKEMLIIQAEESWNIWSK